VNVYYLSTPEGRRFFYYDASEDDASRAVPAAPPSNGLRGWAERKWAAIQKAMDDPNGGAARWVGRAWEWLHSFSHPDETMHAQFGATAEVVLHYPASQPAKSVRKAWRRYLARRSRSHMLWGVVNAVATPPGALLAILPGPNVVGFWFLYRAAYHFLAVRGIRRVRRGVVPTQWRAEDALDAPVARGPNGEPRHEALADSAKLGDYLHWSSPSDSTPEAESEN
jgi:hypothetical protein